MVERGRTDDAAAVANRWVELATDQLRHGSHLEPEANRERIRQSMLKHAVAGTLLVERETGEIVGFVTCAVETGGYEQDVTRGLVENLYIVPERRGDDLGGELLAAAESLLDQRGCDVVALDVMAANVDARRFYERAGYGERRVELEKEL